jgi:hypothetical protein
MSDQSQQPSLIGGHAQYVKGAAEVRSIHRAIPSHPIPSPHQVQPLTSLPKQSAVGAATGSEAWKVSAESDKQTGIDAMKAASQNRDANRDGFGKVEEMAGKAAGCEGMEKEGAASAKTE